MKIRLLAAPALAIALTLPADAQEAEQRMPVDVVAQPRTIMIPKQDALARPPRPPRPLSRQIDWVTDADYPPEAWRNGEEGLVRYELVVSPEGQVTGCRITQSEATPALEAETCRLLRERARFEPGKDAEGKLVSAPYKGAVLWEQREPEVSAGFTLRIAYRIDERGLKSDCRVIERSGVIPRDLQRSIERPGCASRADYVGVPYRDVDGNPVARQVIVSFGSAVEPVPAASGSAQPGN